GAPMFTVGIDPRAEFLYRVVRGRQPGPGELIVSAPLARALGIARGDVVALAGELDGPRGRARATRSYRVSGVGDFLYDYAGEHSLAMPLADAQAATGRAGDVLLFGVAVLRISAAVPEVSAYSARELMGEMDKRLLYFKQLATILGSVAMVVTA